MTCDLHTHSTYSDGTCTPGQIAARAKELALTVALTDHNTAAGLPEFMAEAEKQGVTAVGGIELSTEYEGTELHLLGLFVEPEHYGPLEDLCRRFREDKERSNREMARRLNEAGYRIDYAAVKERSPNGNINRAHIAAQLLAEGYVNSVREAFDTLLREDGPYYVPSLRLQTLEAITTLRKMGVVPVLAHPLQDLSEARLRAMLPRAVEAGLMGLETMHSSYDSAMTAAAEAAAVAFHLLPSGGSDFHGQTKPDTALGTGKGNMAVPESFFHALRQAKEGLAKGT